MKTKLAHQPPLPSRARSLFLLALAAGGLQLGGSGTATSRADILYVDNAANNILKFTSAAVGSTFVATSGTNGLDNPRGLAFDSAGNLFAANANINTIEKFTTGGTPSLFASTGPAPATPAGLAFDTAGNLYAANLGDSTIEKFTPAGTPTQFVTTGLSSPSFLAFTNDAGQPLLLPIPEPSAWAMVVGGLGMLGAFMRLGRRRA